ncbi:MAG TPA: hypothetical protein ENN09_01880 [Planctomycetes bacterium]|nr:hypothetical protein [Planctomycetota bacterium]
MQKILPVVTLALVFASFVMLGLAGRRDASALEEAPTRVSRIDDRIKAAVSSSDSVRTAVESLAARVDRLSARAETIKPPPTPDEAELSRRASEHIDRKWSEFTAKRLLAQGKIGVILPADLRTVRTLRDGVKPAVERLGIRGDAADKTAQAVAEAVVKYGRARAELASDKDALAFERQRLVEEAARTLAKELRDIHHRQIIEMLDARLAGQ